MCIDCDVEGDVARCYVLFAKTQQVNFDMNGSIVELITEKVSCESIPLLAPVSNGGEGRM
jgi:hypothetical protein